MKFFRKAIEILGRKVDNLKTKNAVLRKEMSDLKSSMQFHSDTIDEKVLEVDTKVSQVYVVNDENIKTLIDDHKNLNVKVRDLEGRSRENSFRFDRLSQAQGNEWIGVQPKLKSLSRKNEELRMLRLSVLIEFSKKKEITFCRKEQF